MEEPWLCIPWCLTLSLVNHTPSTLNPSLAESALVPPSPTSSYPASGLWAVYHFLELHHKDKADLARLLRSHWDLDSTPIGIHYFYMWQHAPPSFPLAHFLHTPPIPLKSLDFSGV